MENEALAKTSTTLVEFKQPSFLIGDIDNMLKKEPTLDTLLKNIISLNETIEIFIERHTHTMLTNYGSIMATFSSHYIDPFAIFAQIWMLKRKNELSYLILTNQTQKTDENVNNIYNEMSQRFENTSQTEENTKIVQLLIENDLKDEKEMRGLDPSTRGHFILNTTVIYFNHIIQTAIKYLCLTTINEGNDFFGLEYLYECTKFRVLSIMYVNAFRTDVNHLYNKDECSEEWIKLKRHYRQIVLFSEDKIRKRLLEMKEVFHAATAAIYKSFRYGDGINDHALRIGFYLIYYLFREQKAELDMYKFLVEPKLEIAQGLWGIFDMNGLKQYKKISLPQIEISENYLLLKQSRELDLNYMRELKNKIRAGEYFTDEGLKLKVDMNESKILMDYVECDIVMKEYVKVKLLNYKSKHTVGNKGGLFSCCKSPNDPSSNSLIIHVHGGGFVAGSSLSHEDYLREWSNNLKVPIISIDYRLAPAHQYPAGLNDVWQAYNWIIDHGSDTFNLTFDKILLVGDSAGGALILGLTYLLLMHKRKLPDLLVLCYPVCRTDDFKFRSSHLLNLQEDVPYHLFEVCMELYKGDYINEIDPFIDPQSMDEEVKFLFTTLEYILKRLPSVKFFIGSSDSIRDDAVVHANHLIQLGVDCEIFEFKYFPHAFLSFNSGILMPEARHAINFIREEIRKFILK